MLQIYYGYGKGKTTASIGQAIRCANRNFKVVFTCFLKDCDSGEFLGNIPFTFIKGNFCGKFWADMTDNEKTVAKKEATERFTKIITDKTWDMIVLDELLDAITLGCLDKEKTINLIKDTCDKKEVVVTGHNKVDELFDFADYVTHFQCEKHPFNKGINWRMGIEK